MFLSEYEEIGGTIDKYAGYVIDRKKNKIKYDADGNILHFIRKDGFEYRCMYNSAGKRIHYSDTNGLIKDYEYTEDNKILHYKDSEGYEYKNIFDDKGRLICVHETSTHIRYGEYDKHDNLVRITSNRGIETLMEYDEFGNMITETGRKYKNISYNKFYFLNRISIFRWYMQ